MKPDLYVRKATKNAQKVTKRTINDQHVFQNHSSHRIQICTRVHNSSCARNLNKITVLRLMMVEYRSVMWPCIDPEHKSWWDATWMCSKSLCFLRWCVRGAWIWHDFKPVLRAFNTFPRPIATEREHVFYYVKHSVYSEWYRCMKGFVRSPRSKWIPVLSWDLRPWCRLNSNGRKV